LFEGILHTPGLVQSDVHFVLKKARKLNKEGGAGDFIERLVIPSAEVVQMHAKDLPMQQEAPLRPSVSPVLGFPINADADQVVIQFGDFEDLAFLGDKDRERQGAGLFGRELQKWEPDDGESLTDFEEGEHKVGAWDQFAENEKKFGVKTDFNMDLYTTPLEPEKSKYTVAQAEKLAREIQSASSPNLHLQDERNQLTLDDSGISDEQLYSSVLTEGYEKSDKTAVTPKKGSGRQRTDEKHSKSPERRRMAPQPLILHHGTRPMIIAKPRTDNHSTNARSEFNVLAREISSGKPIPQGSPLNTSPLVNDPERVKALDLTPGTERKTLHPEVRAHFKKFKATASIERPGATRRPETREETLAKLKAFSEQYDERFKKTVKNTEPPFPTSPIRHRTPLTPVTADRDPSGFGSQLLSDEIQVKPVKLEDEEASPDVRTQRELPQLRIEREGIDDDDQGEDHSGRGLNPHATPFNPSQAFQNKSEASLSQTSSDESAVDPSPHASIEEASESADPCEKAVSEEMEVFQPAPPPPMPETLIPAMQHPAQPTVLIRSQPPPPPPRVVTPPPPPPAPMPDVHQQPPMVIPMVRQTHRPALNRPSQSPGRRTPQHHMSQDPPNMVMNPSMIMPAPQSGPPPPSSGPPMPSNGPPPPVTPAMAPHMSGAMHMMPPHVAHYPYQEVGGRVPVFYSYPGPMAPVPGPPGPPGQQNNPNGEQGMPPPQVVYSFYHPAMSQYHMSYPPMMPQGMPPQFVPVPPTPMTPQRPASAGARPRARRNKNSFFNYGPRRG